MTTSSKTPINGLQSSYICINYTRAVHVIASQLEGHEAALDRSIQYAAPEEAVPIARYCMIRLAESLGRTAVDFSIVDAELFTIEVRRSFGGQAPVALDLLSDCVEDRVHKDVWSTIRDAGFAGRLREYVVTNTGELIRWDEADHHVVVDVWRVLKALFDIAGNDRMSLHALVCGFQEAAEIQSDELLALIARDEPAADGVPEPNGEASLSVLDTGKLRDRMDDHLSRKGIPEEKKATLLKQAIAAINTTAVVSRVCRREPAPPNT